MLRLVRFGVAVANCASLLFVCLTAPAAAQNPAAQVLQGEAELGGAIMGLGQNQMPQSVPFLAPSQLAPLGAMQPPAVNPNNNGSPFDPPPSAAQRSPGITATPNTQMSPAQLNALRNASKNIGSIQPPTRPSRGPSSQQPVSTFAAPSATRGSTFSPAVVAPQPRVTAAIYRPGGISLSAAAAQAMPIHIDLDGVYYHDGKLVISGRQNSTQILDAALMLTALRVACEAGDPSFSLDPDDGRAWTAESNIARERLWERVKRDVDWERPVKADRTTVNGHSFTDHLGS